MGKKVLIIDDSASIRKSISYVLSQEGFEVAEAEDGKDGLAKAGKNNFELIVTDINMPNLDGIGFIQEVRKNQVYKFVPIIVLTTENQKSRMQEGKAAGATGWIVKPFSADKLISVVKKISG